MKEGILLWITVLSIIAFCLYGIDKWKAKKNMWRISEYTLIVIALLGGGIGAWIGMRVFHHKTKHWKFKIVVPCSAIVWICIGSYVLLR